MLTNTKKRNREARNEREEEKQRQEERSQYRRKTEIPKDQNTENPPLRKGRKENKKIDPGGKMTRFVANCVLAKQTEREVLDGINTQSERMSQTADAHNIPPRN